MNISRRDILCENIIYCNPKRREKSKTPFVISTGIKLLLEQIEAMEPVGKKMDTEIEKMTAQLL